MTTNELKLQVIDEINKVNDESLLMDLMQLLSNNDDSEIYNLSDKHESAIQTAINQIERGDFVTNYQADKESEDWLKKSG